MQLTIMLNIWQIFKIKLNLILLLQLVDVSFLAFFILPFRPNNILQRRQRQIVPDTTFECTYYLNTFPKSKKWKTRIRSAFPSIPLFYIYIPLTTDFPYYNIMQSRKNIKLKVIKNKNKIYVKIRNIYLYKIIKNE